MKKLLLGLIGLSLVSIPALAGESKLKKGFYTMDSMGCMITRECTKDVRRIKSIDDIRKEFPNSDFDILLMSLTRCWYPLIKSELWFF